MPAHSLEQLLDDLASPDPAVRDVQALPELCDAIAEGRLDAAEHDTLARTLLRRLGHERAEARSFAPLVLAELVACGHGRADWVEPVARWYVAEPDLRGYDAQVGWVHAVAHGADFFGACAVAGVGSPEQLLAALTDRLLAPTDTVWRDQEEDRVAYALALTLARPDVTPATISAWLEPVRSAFAASQPGPVPAPVSNTMRALRSLAVALRHTVVRPAGEASQPVQVACAPEAVDGIDGVLALVTPWFWRRSATDSARNAGSATAS